MRKAFAIALILGVMNVPLLKAAANGEPALPAVPQEETYYEPYTADQLDNLLAPIALYPDPLLAQVLLAATFSDQIDEAARYVRAYGQQGIDDQPWDVSVKAVAHYPSVLFMMADQLDWATAVGQAYVNQSTDVMASVQRLRAMAQGMGNLVTNPEQQVVVEDGFITIWPAQPQYIYVPMYDPFVVYYRRWPGTGPFFVTFGVRFLIGAWLNFDCDWRDHRIFYTGWTGGGWIGRSRPYVHITNIYVNTRFRNIRVNRDVTRRNINFYNLNRFNAIHRDTSFDSRARRSNVYRPNPNINNRMIQRNIETGNPQLNRYRGYQQPAQPQAQPQPQYRPPPQPQQQRQQAPAGERRPAQPQPQARPQPQPQPQYRPQPQQQPGAFGRGDGTFNPREASQRGQSSREAARPAPRQQPQARPQPRPAPSRPAGQTARPAPQSRPSTPRR
jgi:Protein of unknown function (DUF3300)